MIYYSKLWLLLDKMGLKRTDLCKEPCKLTSNTLAKLGKNENVSVETIGKICDFLECQPSDIMENISPRKRAELYEQLSKTENQLSDFLHTMAVLAGKTDEEFAKDMASSFPNDLEKIINK